MTTYWINAIDLFIILILFIINEMNNNEMKSILEKDLRSLSYLTNFSDQMQGRSLLKFMSSIQSSPEEEEF